MTDGLLDTKFELSVIDFFEAFLLSLKDIPIEELSLRTLFLKDLFDLLDYHNGIGSSYDVILDTPDIDEDFSLRRFGFKSPKQSDYLFYCDFISSRTLLGGVTPLYLRFYNLNGSKGLVIDFNSTNSKYDFKFNSRSHKFRIFEIVATQS